MPRSVTMAGAGQPPAADRLYRLYSLSHTGAITDAENREFACDAQALVHAQGLLVLHPAVEVWQTHRFVGRLDRASHIHDQGAPDAPDAPDGGRPGTDREAFARLRQIIEDWRSGNLPPHKAMGAVGQVLGLAVEAAPMVQDMEAARPRAEETG